MLEAAIPRRMIYFCKGRSCFASLGRSLMIKELNVGEYEEEEDTVQEAKFRLSDQYFTKIECMWTTKTMKMKLRSSGSKFIFR
ncbi:hypothetical protein SLEP1_g33095 [Rubroshorea leprosula]|uniref:Uncharacterized protein n=1 Tax=Rubroshorea leprosula TaxID=152421 RepID=A0AAV5KFN8_9ROSI|nr:hypothetical protein SLEP1_g33095 [Rubroshorea leprosula]